MALQAECRCLKGLINTSEMIIGLEIHAELNTKSKIFCSCPAEFGAEPNKNTCPVCLGLPGTLPVLNKEAVRLAVKAGLALNCRINASSRFDRKNYFYPDLPKGYQITQYYSPICENGFIDIETAQGAKKIHISRIHMEEDAGKLIHAEDEPATLIDYNRAGIPLIEIVTEPDMNTSDEAAAFLKALKSILEYAGISDCRMEQGSLRCDVNVSVREPGNRKFGTKVEIKNLNSFRDVQKAIEWEQRRQEALLMTGRSGEIIRETRRWDAFKGETLPMRTKEDTDDYRYFPEPDLPLVIVDNELIRSISDELPELPRQKIERFAKDYMLSRYDAGILARSRHLADFFEEVVSFGVQPKEAANWITVELLRLMKNNTDTDGSMAEITINSKDLAELIKMVIEGKISRQAGKEVLSDLAASGRTPGQIIEERGLAQISGEEELNEIIKCVLAENADAVMEYKNGNMKINSFLMGCIMKASKGKANPNKAKELLEKALTYLRLF